MEGRNGGEVGLSPLVSLLEVFLITFVGGFFCVLPVTYIVVSKSVTANMNNNNIRPFSMRALHRKQVSHIKVIKRTFRGCCRARPC